MHLGIDLPLSDSFSLVFSAWIRDWRAVNDGAATAAPSSFLLVLMRSRNRTSPLQTGSSICFSRFAGSHGEDWPSFLCVHSN
jgi:hypothetical protein